MPKWNAYLQGMPETTTQEETEYLVSREVMELARISRRTLDRWVQLGTLPVIHIEGSQRRYLKSDVDKLLKPAGAAS